jgi:ketosteroid isomerase-like protein
MRPLLLLATLTLPTITHAKPCPTPDPAAIVNTMTTMYAAATVDDSAKLAKLFTPDAVEFDRGERYTGMALWDLIKVVHAKGTKLVWTVQDTDVHFACDTAWIDYSNRGSVSDGKTTQPVSWLESAILVHGASGWKIRFFHSTQVPPLAK